jgi:hypothetical protein
MSAQLLSAHRAGGIWKPPLARTSNIHIWYVYESNFLIYFSFSFFLFVGYVIGSLCRSSNSRLIRLVVHNLS